MSSDRWARFAYIARRTRLFQFGLPFFVLVIGGSFGMQHFAKTRYEYRRAQMLPREVEQAGLTMRKPGEVTLEKEFEKIQKMDIDNWENKRGPRPWEEKF